MSEDELKKCWQKAIATWETAVQSLQESSNRSVQAQVSHGRRRRKVQLTVIPGQPSEPRNIAEHEEFGTSPPATTVIHAVCWGRNRVWEPENRNIMLETLRESNGNPVNLEQIFAETRKNELDNFRRFSDDVLTKSWRNQEGLTLIVAVTMSDLFKDRLDEVESGSASVYAAAPLISGVAAGGLIAMIFIAIGVVKFYRRRLLNFRRFHHPAVDLLTGSVFATLAVFCFLALPPA